MAGLVVPALPSALGHSFEHKLAFGLAEVAKVTCVEIRTIMMLFRKGITSIGRVAAR